MERVAGAALKLCVLDASVAVAWYLPNQANPLTDALLHGAAARTWCVPACFHYEIAQVMLRFEQRGELPFGMTEVALADLQRLGVASCPEPDLLEFSKAITLARKYRISVFDAFYLRLASSQNALLVTRDGSLVSAALREHCAVEDLQVAQ